MITLSAHVTNVFAFFDRRGLLPSVSSMAEKSKASAAVRPAAFVADDDEEDVDGAGSDGDIDSGEERERREIERRYRPASASVSSAVREYVGPSKHAPKDVVDYGEYLKRRAKEEWQWATTSTPATASASAPSRREPAVIVAPPPLGRVGEATARSQQLRDATAPVLPLASQTAAPPLVVAPTDQGASATAPCAPPPPPQSDYERLLSLIDADIRKEDEERRVTKGAPADAAVPSVPTSRQPSSVTYVDPINVPPDRSRWSKATSALPDPAEVATLHTSITQGLEKRKLLDAEYFAALMTLDHTLGDEDSTFRKERLLASIDLKLFEIAKRNPNAFRQGGEHTHEEFMLFKQYTKLVEAEIATVLSNEAPSHDPQQFLERLVDENDDVEDSCFSLAAWEVLLAALKFEAFCDLADDRVTAKHLVELEANKRRLKVGSSSTVVAPPSAAPPPASGPERAAAAPAPAVGGPVSTASKPAVVLPSRSAKPPIGAKSATKP